MAYLLVVDDDADFARAAADTLASAGHEVAVCLGTADALASMKERPPDLVILDVIFPEDSSAGFGLARTMRHCESSLRDVPILLLTAINMAFPLGFSARDIDDERLPVAGFVEKPVDFDVLVRKVEDLLTGKGGAGPEGLPTGGEPVRD